MQLPFILLILFFNFLFDFFLDFSFAFFPCPLCFRGEHFLPRSRFAAEPPDHSHSCSVLVRAIHALATGQKDWPVGKIAPVFPPHVKSICQSEVIGCGNLF